ncbi:cytochrome P450 [Aspergillus venezuelensis]
MASRNFTAALLGVVSYLCYFRRGEHHFHTLFYCKTLLFMFTVAVITLVYGTERNAFDAISQIFSIVCYYIIGVFSCLTLYNLFLHPLRKFPGPLGAKVSTFWLSAQVAQKRNAFQYIHHLHKRYGPFVRVGRSEFSIAHPQAVETIYGKRSKCTNSAWYDISRPVISLQTFRDRSLYDARRRIWSAAFSDRQLRGYEQRIQVHRRKLMNHIWSVEGKPIDMTKWFKLYSFDFMGDLAFGQGFDMLESRREHWAVQLLADGFKPFGYMLPVWFFFVLKGLPWAGEGLVAAYWVLF